MMRITHRVDGDRDVYNVRAGTQLLTSFNTADKARDYIASGTAGRDLDDYVGEGEEQYVMNENEWRTPANHI